MRKVDVAERQARLARRHRLAPAHRADDVLEAARSMVCLHGTDPVTVRLSAWARVDGMTVSDMERALYDDRSLVKHLAMRRTLFVFSREMLPMAQAGPATASPTPSGADSSGRAASVDRAVRSGGESSGPRTTVPGRPRGPVGQP